MFAGAFSWPAAIDAVADVINGVRASFLPLRIMLTVSAVPILVGVDLAWSLRVV